MSINSVSISGNLTRDPEVRNTANGLCILNFSIAVIERAKDANGQWANKPNFVDCVIFGNYAAALAPSMHKGVKTAICGKLSQDTWTDRQGNNRSKLKVIVSELEVFSQPSPQQAQQTQPMQYAQPPMQGQQVQYTAPPVQAQPIQPQMQQAQLVQPSPQAAQVYDEDIPF